MIDPVRDLLECAMEQGDPFPADSRYHGVGILAHRTTDGRQITHVKRRFVPPADAHAQIGEHVVSRGERLDTLAARLVGTPEQFWRLCDANDAIRPADLVEEPGTRLRVTLPPGIPGATR